MSQQITELEEVPVSIHKVYYSGGEKDTATPTGTAVMLAGKQAILVADPYVVECVLNALNGVYSDAMSIEDSRLQLPIVGMSVAVNIAQEHCSEYQMKTYRFTSDSLRQIARRKPSLIGAFKQDGESHWSFREDILMQYIENRNKLAKAKKNKERRWINEK